MVLKIWDKNYNGALYCPISIRSFRLCSLSSIEGMSITDWPSFMSVAWTVCKHDFPKFFPFISIETKNTLCTATTLKKHDQSKSSKQAHFVQTGHSAVVLCQDYKNFSYRVNMLNYIKQALKALGDFVLNELNVHLWKKWGCLRVTSYCSGNVSKVT